MNIEQVHGKSLFLFKKNLGNDLNVVHSIGADVSHMLFSNNISAYSSVDNLYINRCPARLPASQLAS